MKRKLIILLFAILPVTFIWAQGEYGSWTTISLEKELSKKWELGAEAELRTIYYARLMERMSLGLSADYTILKGWKVGAGYQIMNKLDTKYLNYQVRNRFNLSTSGRLKFNDLTISLRERIQLTTKDDSKRIRDDQTIDTYKINPEWKWRNRVQISYNIPNFKITPTFSVESNFQLNNPDGNHFDKMRYILSLGYKIKKVHQIEVFGVLNDEFESDDAGAIISSSDDDVYGKYNLGIGYKYSF
ncbi:MAG: DUF2490 domain-containing protein [Paludibacter sp.]|nr:DUF2490 domain-containing protein [Paludibacter sp.]